MHQTLRQRWLATSAARREMRCMKNFMSKLHLMQRLRHSESHYHEVDAPHRYATLSSCRGKDAPMKNRPERDGLCEKVYRDATSLQVDAMRSLWISCEKRALAPRSRREALAII
ncbi:MAG: hypothetical protein EXS10_07750 [Phycisphaerales bacterium]|nr:hypothetical protein [Phycisphaerales bacterium]